MCSIARQGPLGAVDFASREAHFYDDFTKCEVAILEGRTAVGTEGVGRQRLLSALGAKRVHDRS